MKSLFGDADHAYEFEPEAKPSADLRKKMEKYALIDADLKSTRAMERALVDEKEALAAEIYEEMVDAGEVGRMIDIDGLGPRYVSTGEDTYVSIRKDGPAEPARLLTRDGDEFLIWLPDTTVEALKFLEEHGLQRIVEAHVDSRKMSKEARSLVAEAKKDNKFVTFNDVIPEDSFNINAKQRVKVTKKRSQEK